MPPELNEIARRFPAWTREWPSLKWVAPENLHLTLKFLGEVPPDRLSSVQGAARETAAGAKPFEAALEGMGAFPDPARARVLWIGVSAGSVELSGLAARAEERFEGAGFTREERPWTPHLTLARARGGASPGLDGFIRRETGPSFGRFRVSAIHLMESQLGPTGPRYRPTGEFPLEPA